MKAPTLMALIVIFFGVLALGLQPVSSAPAISHAQSIVGSWVIVPTGGPRRVHLLTFTADGAVVWSSPRGDTSGGHGEWVRTGDRTVTETAVASRHNAGGDFIGTTKVRMKLTLDATFDEVAGSGRSDDFDAQGNLVQSVKFTNHGTRIKVESP